MSMTPQFPGTLIDRSFRERIVLVGVVLPGATTEEVEAALDELAAAYQQARTDPAFQAELQALLTGYAGRPTLLTRAARFGEQAGGATVLLKREDLTHTGSHKINNVLGQVLLARRMGKTRVIAETGAGQHGVATATAAALLGLECAVYMGEEDTHRQALNVSRMRMLGAEVIPVTAGTRSDAWVGGLSRKGEECLTLISGCRTSPASMTTGSAARTTSARTGRPPSGRWPSRRPSRPAPGPTGGSSAGRSGA